MADNNNQFSYSDLIKPDNSISNLIKQLDELSDTYANALKNIKGEAIQLAEILQKVSGATEQGRGITKKAADDADRLARAQRELAFAESENAKVLAELKLAQREANTLTKLRVQLNSSEESSYNKLSAQYSINKIFINNMTKAERENTEAGKELVKQTKEMYEEMKRMQEVTGKNQLNVGNYKEAGEAVASYGEKLKESLGLNNDFGNALLALGQKGDAGKAALTAIGDGAKALGKTLLGLLSNPVFLAIAGIAGAGLAVKWWYDYNAGLVEATRLTQQFTGKEGDDLKAFRNQVQAIADTFNQDFNEVLKSANALSKQFGISADEALKLVQDGLVAGGDANGEFTRSLKEYPTFFKEAGISAAQFVAIVSDTNKQGIYSDKGVDAIKEGNIRIREMTKATAKAFDAIGLSSVQAQKDLQTGSKTTFQIMQEVSKRLSELPDNSAKVGAAIADIFGGPGEDAGLQYIRTLKDISTDLDTVKSKTGALGALQEQQLKSQVELENNLAALFDITGGTFEELTTKAKVFVNNGINAVIKGVIDLINYFVEFYNDSIAFRTLWTGIGTAFKTTFDLIGNLFNAFISIVKATGKILQAAFTLDLDAMKEGLQDYANAFPALIKAQMKDTNKNFQDGLDNMSKKLKPITIPISVGNTSNTTVSGGITTTNPTVDTTEADEKAKKEAEKAAKKAEEIYKTNLALKRKYEDEQLKLEKDEFKKREAQTSLNYSRQIEDLRHQLDTDKKLNTEGKKAITDTIVVLEQNRTEDILKIQRERQLQELELERQSIDLRLASVKKGSEEEQRLRLQLNENNRKTALAQNAQKPVGQKQNETDINAKFNTSASGITDEYLNAQLLIFEQQQALAQSEYDLLRNSEGRKTRFRLQAEKERLAKILALNEQASTKMTATEVATIQNTMAKIDQEIEKSKGDEKSKDIYGLLGLNLDDEKKEAISTSVSFAIDQLTSLMNAKVAAADAAVSAADKEIDSAQNALDRELEARANGYASNVVMAQKELELARKNQEKALRDQKKAQKEQAQIQALQQIGDLVTASAMIWSQLGFPWAIPAIAVMWGSFAFAKIKAAQMAKQTGSESYGEGTVELLEGGSHQSGNDIDLGRKSNGVRRRAEGGEYFAVINKRNSRKFRRYIPDVIKSLNNGSFADKYLGAYNSDGLNLSIAGDSPDLRDISSDVREIRERQALKTYTDGRGNTVETYKNLKRIIKK